MNCSLKCQPDLSNPNQLEIQSYFENNPHLLHTQPATHAQAASQLDSDLLNSLLTQPRPLPIEDDQETEPLWESQQIHSEPDPVHPAVHSPITFPNHPRLNSQSIRTPLSSAPLLTPPLSSALFLTPPLSSAPLVTPPLSSARLVTLPLSSTPLSLSPAPRREHVVCLRYDLSLVNREYLHLRGGEIGYIFVVDGLYDLLDLATLLVSESPPEEVKRGDSLVLFVDDVLLELPTDVTLCVKACWQKVSGVLGFSNLKFNRIGI